MIRFAIVILLIMPILFAGYASAQDAICVIDTLTAIYGGQTSYWILESSGSIVDVIWEQYGHAFGDNRFYVTGTSPDLPETSYILFVSQQNSNHGLVALVIDATCSER